MLRFIYKWKNIQTHKKQLQSLYNIHCFDGVRHQFLHYLDSKTLCMDAFYVVCFLYYLLHQFAHKKSFILTRVCLGKDIFLWPCFIELIETDCKKVYPFHCLIWMCMPNITILYFPSDYIENMIWRQKVSLYFILSIYSLSLALSVALTS